MKGKLKKPNLTRERVREALDYDPVTGIFIWKISPARNVRAGAAAGTNNKGNGYRYIRLDGEEVTAARLAIFYMTGEWPEGRVQFKNGDIEDHRFENFILFNRIDGEFDHNTREGRVAYLRTYRRASPALEKARNLRKKFNLSIEDYDRMLEAQGGVCAICKQPETHKRNDKVKALAVDHDHRTGKIRGLLCADCNTGIGKLKDSIDVLTSAVQYLSAT